MKPFDHQSGYHIEIEGAKIYYEETGNKNKPVMLVLHGGFQHIEDMNPLIPFFADEYRIIGIDSRGHGKSTLGTGKLTYERLELDTLTVLKHLDIKSASILGFSDGGIIGYRLAAAKRYLDISELITIGGTWHINDALLTEELFQKITPQSWKEKFPESVEKYQKLNPAPEFEKFTNLVKEMWLDKETTGYPNEAVSKIECPTLIVRGDQDHLFSRKSAAELSDKIKNAVLFNVPFAGHVVFTEQKEIFRNVLKQFLSR